jgi:hypothetical protein
VDANLTTAIVSATALVAITALLSNNKRFDDMNGRMTRLEAKLAHIHQILVGYCLGVK